MNRERKHIEAHRSVEFIEESKATQLLYLIYVCTQLGG